MIKWVGVGVAIVVGTYVTEWVIQSIRDQMRFDRRCAIEGAALDVRCNVEEEISKEIVNADIDWSQLIVMK